MKFVKFVLLSCGVCGVINASSNAPIDSSLMGIIGKFPKEIQKYLVDGIMKGREQMAELIQDDRDILMHTKL